MMVLLYRFCGVFLLDSELNDNNKKQKKKTKNLGAYEINKKQ